VAVGKLVGHMTFAVDSSTATCTYHGGTADVVRVKRIHAEEGPPQLWQTWGVNPKSGPHNSSSCPKKASTLLGPYESLTATGTTPVHLGLG
jgi:hypothetical protein